jgi:hypothetical protein
VGPKQAEIKIPCRLAAVEVVHGLLYNYYQSQECKKPFALLLLPSSFLNCKKV